MSALPPWIRVALKEVGVEEPNPRILDYFKDTDYPDPTARTAYCAAFANYCLDQAGYKGSGHANAVSFQDWGRDVSKTRPLGCVAVFAFGPTEHHVSFWMGNGKFLGGNQTREHEVCIEAIPVARAIAWRMPADWQEGA